MCLKVFIYYITKKCVLCCITYKFVSLFQINVVTLHQKNKKCLTPKKNKKNEKVFYFCSNSVRFHIVPKEIRL